MQDKFYVVTTNGIPTYLCLDAEIADAYAEKERQDNPCIYVSVTELPISY